MTGVTAHPNPLDFAPREPIAIIGIGCRFPGARDVSEFWSVLAEGRDTIRDYPGGRFPYIDHVYTSGSPFAERIATSRGGFLTDIDRFDADFFGISPREASLLDPQQRLLLEVACEAVDDAGLPREKLAATRAGVFVGVWTSDYEDCLYEYSPDVDFHATTGGGRYGVSGRLAYFLDLRGPNLTVDTACSSSLVAIHLACQSLLTGESTIAFAGGVNTILRPEITLVYSNAGMLAPDGKCKFGDAAADGYVRSEGAGVVVLKRLSRAIADNDPIYAVIRGSAVNNDGQSSGLLVSPSRVGQEDVIRTALESAGLTPDTVDYVEAHGTGTLTGDPVEIETIGRVMTSGTRSHPCAVGSVKTNIGHTESAAGVAGIAKVALALNHGLIPASLNFENPSPHVAWPEFQVSVPTRSAVWPAQGRQPIAGVSGFGITGTNAHIVLEGVDRALHPKRVNAAHGDEGDSGWPHLFLLSAQSQAALKDVAASWRQRLAEDLAWPESLADLAHTAGARRTQHPYRLTIAASDRSELDTLLGEWLEGVERPGVESGRQLEQPPQKVVFVYPGQGGQWIGMGRALHEQSPVFRDALQRCDAAIRPHTDWSVVEALLAAPDVSRLHEIDVIQPTLFALMIALTEVWRSLGVEPDAVVGHSMGEAAAAVVAGALSLEDGAAVICHRSRLMKRVQGKGRMAVVELGLDAAADAIREIPRVWVGASNSANSTVISGDADAIDALISDFETREIFCRRIQVDVASHSGHMEEVRDDLEAALTHVQPRAGAIPMYSTTTGEVEDGSRLDATYWGKNLRQPVLFHPAVERLLHDNFDAFVEINAHPVLTHAITETVVEADREAVITGTLRRDSNDQREVLGAIGRLHSAGYAIDMQRLIPDGNCIRLPAYPWQRERHWFEPSAQAISAQQQRLSGKADNTATGLADRAGVAGPATPVDPANCLYELTWTDTPVQSAKKQACKQSHWLVFANDPHGDAIATALRTREQTYTTVRPGTRFHQIDANTFEIDPTSESDVRRLFDGRTTSLRGVVHAWSLRSIADSDADGTIPDNDRILEAQTFGSLSAACLVRSIANLSLEQPPKLWLITRGAHAIDGAPVANPWDAPLLGLGRIVATEHSEMPCTNLDLSAQPNDIETQYAAQVITNDVSEQQIAIRGLRQLRARYRRTNKPSGTGTPSTIRGDATYVITGGLGGIGLQTARWLVDQGARFLVLAGRSGPSAEATVTIDALTKVGAQVKVVSADISDPAQAQALVETAAFGMPPVKGVFHMAVVVDHALVREATDESFRRVFAPKLIGAWNLYRALREQSLDFYVLFSSMVGVIPQPSSGSYAAANAFLDGLARYGTARGVPVQSIQWEPWAGTGLMNEGKTRGALRIYEAQGVRPMSPTLGFQILETALKTKAPVLLAASVDWCTFATVCSANAGASEFLHFANERDETSRSGMASQMHSQADVSSLNMREVLSALAPGRPRLQALELHLRERLASVLKTTPSRLDVQKPMGSMGIDSLLALEFVRQLARSLDIKVPATVVFNYPTIKKLAVLLESRMEFDDAKKDETTNMTVGSSKSSHTPNLIESNVDDMSDLDAIQALSGNRR